MIRLVAQRYLARFRRRYIAPSASTSAIVLAMLALVLVLMPVSYKAGTSTSHPHTVFQVILDQVRGETHTHAEHADATGDTQPTFFLALDIPLSTFIASPASAIESMVLEHHLTHTLGLPAVESDPDLPQLTSLHGASETGATMTMMAALWALLFLRQPIRRIWHPQRTLRGIRDALEGPPPRPSAA